MDSKIHKAILKTLVYADLFSYPLTIDELWKYLIWDEEQAISRSEFNSFLQKARIGFVKTKGYVVLSGKKDLLLFRESRANVSRKKMNYARTAGKSLMRIPFIKLIGISGSLSMNNAKEEDDIDLFIVTSKDTLWITRFLVLATLLFSGILRRKSNHKIKNKICPNMFVSDDALSFTQNLYIAHEIVQMKLLVNRSKTYERIISQNNWIFKFLPNASVHTLSVLQKKNWLSIFFKPLNLFCFFLQFLYMKKKITREKISYSFAAFHPRDSQKIVMDFFNNRWDYVCSILRLNLTKNRGKFMN